MAFDWLLKHRHHNLKSKLRQAKLFASNGFGTCRHTSHRRPSNVPHLSTSQCRSAQAVAHFVGKVCYRRAAANQHTVETPPWPTSTGRGSMLLSSSQPATLSNSRQHPLHVTTPNTNKHLLVVQTRDGGQPGKLLHCRRQRRFERIKIHLTLVLDGALE